MFLPLARRGRIDPIIAETNPGSTTLPSIPLTRESRTVLPYDAAASASHRRIPAYAGMTVGYGREGQQSRLSSIAYCPDIPAPFVLSSLTAGGNQRAKINPPPFPHYKPQQGWMIFMDATAALARFIAATEYESLPPAAVAAAKTAILDGVANMAAGSVQELAAIIGRYTRDLGGAPHCSVVGRLVPRDSNSLIIPMNIHWSSNFSSQTRFYLKVARLSLGKGYQKCKPGVQS